MTSSCRAPLPSCHVIAIRCLAICVGLGCNAAASFLYADDGTLATRFPAVQAILLNQCQACHGGEKHEGEFDLQQYPTMTEVRVDVMLWQQIANLVRHSEMPPPESPPLKDADRTTLLDWIDDFIKQELQQSTGDPGPTILRRLNSAEYTYTLQDLTGVLLQPASEFPVEGAAGEGFINAGEALSMSPALLQKHLDAAKSIAAHAVLTPDGARFSISTSRRDWEEELLLPIREIYARHTSGRTDARYLDQWSGDPRRLLENDGRVDLTPYFAALLTHRDALQADPSKAAEIANAAGLNAKYLQLMARSLTDGNPHSILLESWRQQWLRRSPQEVNAWVQQVDAWQKQLWKFQSVSHLGLIQPWQAPVTPLQTRLPFKQPISAVTDGSTRHIALTIGCAGDKGEADQVIMHRPRIEYAGRPAVLLRDVPQLTAMIRQLQSQELARLDDYLMAIASASRSIELETAPETPDTRLHHQLYDRLAKLLDLQVNQRPVLAGHFKTAHAQVAGQDAIQAWSTDELPVMLANSSDQAVSFSTLTVPAKSVTLHPTPDKAAAVAWQCPQSGEFAISLDITDQDEKCGNGIHWSLEQLLGRGGQTKTLASGDLNSGTHATWSSDAPVSLAAGDVVQVVISARDGSHVCDTTGVNLVLISLADGRKWDLAADVVSDLLSANPHVDSYGNGSVWHFLSPADANEASPIPADSTLARWRQAVIDSPDSSATLTLARTIREQLVAPESTALSSADADVRRSLLAWHGPLGWLDLAQTIENETAEVADASSLFGVAFGPRDSEPSIDEASLLVSAPIRLSCLLPVELIADGQLVLDVTLFDPQSSSGSVQVQLDMDEPSPVSRVDENLSDLMPGVPILIADNDQARKRWEQAFADFRSLFPAAMCHAQIVPIDAVVTLVLFHREDEPLCRLMLSNEEAKGLDHLWQELHFVSEDALRMETSLEQILEFSTQDADPKFFDPVRQPIADHAARFRSSKLAAQPGQLDWLLSFAARAFRRPLSATESERLSALYHRLREQSVEHEAVMRLLIARVLSSPPFLYRLESAADQAEPSQLPAYQLASRLSYFLWSSMPDEPLSQLAASDALFDPVIRQSQVDRMLQDPRARRLAIEFLCQWMHLRDFDWHDEKSEQAFPEFASLRGEMYEETIQFFTHLIQDDRSILELLNADYAWLNETMARHYGVPDVQGTDWRKVEQAQRFGRGGVLALSTVLASQSGASRTSPVLRGNWITETLLGERLPKPPKDVPVIPDGDGSTQTLTVRQLVERHTADAACVKCHQRIDPYGLALERYDAIGRLRDMDAGQAIDSITRLPDGTELEGLDGVRDYLLQKRQSQFVRQVCRKLLGFALGRSLVLGDEPLLQEMEAALKQNEYRFSAAIDTIVASRSFQMIRGKQYQPVTFNEQ